jgi:hypothetical protein
MIGENHVSSGTYNQLSQFTSHRSRSVEFFEQSLRTDDHSTSQDGDRAWMQDSGRDELELERLSAGDDGVSGVVAPGVPDNHFGLMAEHIDELSFGFVAPLGTYNCERWHIRSPLD